MSPEHVIPDAEGKDLLRFVTAGSVDDGKSTLIGRLLLEAKGIYDDQLAALRDRPGPGSGGRGELDLALLTDGLRAEREQGITIDVAYRYFSTPRRKFIIADTPGHEQYTRNMATGASTASLVVVLVDAANGVTTQSKRHAFIAALLGIPHFVVAVNKMDLVDYSEPVFEAIREEFADFAARLEISDLTFIPVSALVGDNVVHRSGNMPWYGGATLLDHLETLHIASDRNLIDLRLPVQMALRPGADFRGYLGTVASGVVRPGDEVMALPSGVRTRVKTVFGPDGEIDQAFPPMAAGITLEDEIDLGRGDMIVHVHNVPRVDRTLDAMVVWMDPEPMVPGKSYRVKHTTRTVRGIVSALRYRMDVNTLHRTEAKQLGLNEIGRCTITLSQPVAHDPYSRNRATGSLILIDPASNNTVGAGMILDREPDEPALAAGSQDRHIAWEAGGVAPCDRERMLGQKGCVVWLTGLSGSGKSTIARCVEQRLMEMGKLAFILDGDNVRHGLNVDLGFLPAERDENIRRVGEVAALLTQAGMIAVVAFISPYRAGRDRARGTTAAGRFVEVHVDTPLAECERRDPKGLYRRARAGEISDFTGIDAPYEAPRTPEVVLETIEADPQQCARIVVEYLAGQGLLSPPADPADDVPD